MAAVFCLFSKEDLPSTNVEKNYQVRTKSKLLLFTPHAFFANKRRRSNKIFLKALAQNFSPITKILRPKCEKRRQFLS